MKCNIIRDLLPMYCDDLTSEDSNEEIRAHLAGCKECSAIYDSMSAAEMKIPESKKNIKPMKKLRKRIIITLASIVGAVLILYSAVVFYVFNIQKPIDPSELEIRIATDMDYNPVVGADEPMVVVTVLRKDRKPMALNFKRNDNGLLIDGTYHTDLIVEAYPAPFVGGVNGYTAGFHPSEDSVLTIVGKNESVTYNISDLLKENEIELADPKPLE